MPEQEKHIPTDAHHAVIAQRRERILADLRKPAKRRSRLGRIVGNPVREDSLTNQPQIPPREE